MYTKPTTLTEFILQEEKKFKHATGNLTLLLTQIENAAKIIASHIKKTGLVDIIAETGTKNIQQEEVKKIDEFSNKLLVDTLSASGKVGLIASEELEEPVILDKGGHYNVFFDPLDGSSNIDVGVSVGTIFSIYHNGGEFLQPGIKQVASGYILYGTSIMFVLSHGNGVNGFTLDPAIGSFLLSHPNIKIPQKGNIYSVNESQSPLWDKKLYQYIKKLKENGAYKLRYVGSMVADVHRTLLKGGIFLYPENQKNPQGKLRLMYEVNPLSFIVQQAGGKAASGSKNPLDIIPESLHQRVPIVLGSPDDVDYYLSQTH